jgi:hypothetical protein
MKRVSICDSFDALPKPFEDIFSGLMPAGFFSSLPWFRHFAETVLSPNNSVRIYGVNSAQPVEGLALALPMRQEIPGPGKIGLRRLIALGNYYTPLFNPVTPGRSGCTQADLDSLARAIATERPKWDVVDLHPLQAEGPLFDGILNAFSAAGMMAASYFCFGNWYLEVNNRSYREYHDTLPSRLRNTIRRKSGRLAKTGRLRIEIITNDDRLADTVAAFEQVYNSSWKTPEPHPQFIPGLIRICAERAWLRMGIAYIDDEPAAAQLWIVHEGIASIYKLAYDERFSAESVGSILTARLMQHVIDIDKVRQVDFLSGDDPYKRDWMSHRRERRGIIAYNLRTTYGLLGALRHTGGTLWKRIAPSRAGRTDNLPQKDSAICDNRPR